MVYYEWCRLDPEDVFTLTESAARQRIYRFMRRNDLVIRRTTHHSQREQNDPAIISDWISYLQDICKTYGITLDRVANFDETDVQFAVKTNTTITRKGQKTVSVRLPNSSSRCTVMLGCSANGYKFPPFVIYQAKPGARVAKELRKKEEKGYSPGCEYTVQENAWMNKYTMIEWVEQ
eukprot:scaffold1452_cov174-Amphora_coffeaeformis.AAC.1